MTNKKKAPAPVIDKSRHITVVCREGEDPKLASARVLFGPHVMNANIVAYFGKSQIGELPAIGPLIAALEESSNRVNSNDMRGVEATLISQAAALNVIFGELSRRSALNMGEYLEASGKYLRMALKAQNQCRMTLETLSNIKNPPVVYARQANIANGPQQVNNGTQPRAQAEENKNQPNKLLEQSDEKRMDTPAQDETSAGNTAMETLAAGDWAKNG